MSEILRFETNIPQTVRLKFDTGKVVEGRFGNQVMFTLADNRTMYVSPIVADRIAELRLTRGEPVTICKREVRNAGAKPSITWEVTRAEEPPQPKQQPKQQPPQPRQPPPQQPPQQPPQARPAPPAPVAINDPKANRSQAAKRAWETIRANRAAAAAAAAAPAPQPQRRPEGPPPEVPYPGLLPAPPTKIQFNAAMRDYLIMAGRATREAEKVLGAEGGSVRFDNRDVAALATTAFIQSAREGWLIHTPADQKKEGAA